MLQRLNRDVALPHVWPHVWVLLPAHFHRSNPQVAHHPLQGALVGTRRRGEREHAQRPAGAVRAREHVSRFADGVLARSAVRLIHHEEHHARRVARAARQVELQHLRRGEERAPLRPLLCARARVQLARQHRRQPCRDPHRRLARLLLLSH